MSELDMVIGDAVTKQTPLTKSLGWRLVYFKPNAYSDEAISVGVVVDHEDRVFVDYVCSTDALEMFTNMFGAHARDQLMFGLDLLKGEILNREFDFSAGLPPTNSFKFGRVRTAVCDDVEGFARDLLRLSSSLFRRYEVVSNRFRSVGQSDIIASLKQRIVELAPLRARELIRTATIRFAQGGSFKVPLCGPRTIGTPVSLMTSRVGEAVKGAEAQMMKLSYAKKVLHRNPYLYVYTPPMSEDSGSILSRVTEGLEELRTLGENSGVHVSWSDSIDELATTVLHNEDLEPEQQLLLQ